MISVCCSSVLTTVQYVRWINLSDVIHMIPTVIRVLINAVSSPGILTHSL